MLPSSLLHLSDAPSSPPRLRGSQIAVLLPTPVEIQRGVPAPVRDFAAASVGQIMVLVMAEAASLEDQVPESSVVELPVLRTLLERRMIPCWIR